MTFWYRVCYWICRIGLFFWHPSLRVTGLSNVPAGRVILCANHSGMADPIWLLLALNSPKMIRILAKQELRQVPVVGWVMEKFRIIFVRRGEHDAPAVDECVRALREENDRLLVFIEGTRCNGSKHVRAKTGAVRMALAADAPVLPVFITRNKTPFCPIEVKFGHPYRIEDVSAEDSQACHRAADELLAKIYTLGGDSDADHIGENSGLLLRS